jgi:uncharacterized protein (TIGR03118 family)
MLLKHQPGSQVKSRTIRSRVLPVILTLSFIALISANRAGAQFKIVNLVSDQPGVAMLQDTNLVNAWGISLSGASPFWVSNNGTGTSTLYSVNAVTNAPTKVALTVRIPGAGNVTGQVFNGGTGFNGDAFLFVSEDGTVSGWRGALGTNAETLVIGSAANSYKGTARAVVGGNAYLLAANFKTGNIDVFKGTAAAPDLAGKFIDPGIPSGFAPFNIQNLNNKIYVTYALVGPTGDDLAGAGNGFVAVFDTNGNFLGRVGSNGTLNSPWGLALAPASFGALAGDLLVGNFGDGTINVFDLGTNSFEGQLTDGFGNPLAIDGLWGLTVGNNGAAGSSNKLYFSAGPTDESHGLFGVLAAVPEPSSYAMLSAGLLPAWLALKRRKR